MPRVWSRVCPESLGIRAVCVDPCDDPDQGVAEGLPQRRDTRVADGRPPFPRPLSSGGKRPHWA